MKKYLSLFLVLAIGLINGSYAQKKSEKLENTLLWEISGKGIEKPSYLFGTLHMMCNEQYNLKDKVTKRMSETEQTVLEVNFSDPNEMKEMQKLMLADQKLSEQFNDSELERLREGLTKYQLKLEDVDQLSTVALFSTLSMKFLDCPPTEMKMIDLELLQQTMAERKKVIGFETIKQQSNIFSKYLTSQELLKLVENFDKNKEDLQQLIQSYNDEDLTALGNKMHDTENMSLAQQELMLSQRNRNWIKKMPEMMQTPTFFAVGAGHLTGENGLITLLRNAGYKVNPVME